MYVCFGQGGQRDKKSTGFESAEGWRGQCVPEGKGQAASIRKAPRPPDPCPPSRHQQTPPHSGREGGFVLGGTVPRMKNAGVGNHIKGLGLFGNLYTSDHQTAERQGHSSLWKLWNNRLGPLPICLHGFLKEVKGPQTNHHPTNFLQAGSHELKSELRPAAVRARS